MEDYLYGIETIIILDTGKTYGLLMCWGCKNL